MIGRLFSAGHWLGHQGSLVTERFDHLPGWLQIFTTVSLLAFFFLGIPLGVRLAEEAIARWRERREHPRMSEEYQRAQRRRG